MSEETRALVPEMNMDTPAAGVKGQAEAPVTETETTPAEGEGGAEGTGSSAAIPAAGVAAVIAPDPGEEAAKNDIPAGPTKEEVMAMSDAEVYSAAHERIRTERTARKSDPFAAIILDVIRDRCLHSMDYCRRVVLGVNSYDMLKKYIAVKAIRAATALNAFIGTGSRETDMVQGHQPGTETQCSGFLPVTDPEVFRWVDEFYALDEEKMKKLKAVNIRDLLSNMFRPPSRKTPAAETKAPKADTAEKKPKKPATRKPSKKKTAAKDAETAKAGESEVKVPTPASEAGNAKTTAEGNTTEAKRQQEAMDSLVSKPAPEGTPVQMSLF